ncbi:hypothetical protein [uncultured Alistipes sp.]|uniref:hypothetical protein n=1 Tax=uncultured Alistipes sp. TaxID=538949 RepID=UPI002627A7C3|nr:hypothetical protein [uncultured Alistipes sp.]
MRQKIEEAVQQLNKTLGLGKTTIDGLVALAMTVVKDESEIEGFVNSEQFKGLMKSYQSEADMVRTKASNSKKAEYEAKIAELEAKLNGNNSSEPKPQPEQPDIAALIEAALDKKLNPITEELNAFKATRAKETAVAALDKLCAEWDYAQGFPKERDEAKRIALKVYKAGGEQMSGEQLIAAFREEFDPAVKSKGVTDFSQPFKSDGASGGEDADFSAFDKAVKKLGWVEPEK